MHIEIKTGITPRLNDQFSVAGWPGPALYLFDNQLFVVGRVSVMSLYLNADQMELFRSESHGDGGSLNVHKLLDQLLELKGKT